MNKELVEYFLESLNTLADELLDIDKSSKEIWELDKVKEEMSDKDKYPYIAGTSFGTAKHVGDRIKGIVKIMQKELL